MTFPKDPSIKEYTYKGYQDYSKSKLPNVSPPPRITREEAEEWVEKAFTLDLIKGLLDQIYGFDSKGEPVEPITIPKG